MWQDDILNEIHAPPIQIILWIFASMSGAFSKATATVVNGPVTIYTAIVIH